jgi:hypothetical protein
LAEAARLVFWQTAPGSPSSSEALERLLARRLDQAFRRADLTRAILDDDGDEDWRVARWLVHPTIYPMARGFVDEVRFLYPEHFGEGETSPTGIPQWASVLQLDPPFNLKSVRNAYRMQSKTAHPDAGGSHHLFIQLQAAYEEALEYCRIMGV